MERVAYEVCVESVSDARAAERGGAARVELCAGLLEGGTTPSHGMMEATRAAVRIPLFALIRPRPGDFGYTDEEVAVMERDISLARQAGLDGVALGILTSAGVIDTERVAKLVREARPLAVTFHRAFDLARDRREALEAVRSLGIARLLSSGGAASALDGVANLRELVLQAGEDVTIVAAGGVRAHNVCRIVAASGVRAVHGSASSGETVGFQGRRTTDERLVHGVVRALEALEPRTD